MLKALVVYFQFFTAIPIRLPVSDYKQVFRKGIQWFWLFALAYGLILALIYSFLRLWWGQGPAWLAVMIADILLTRGFHHDGLADSADGLLSGRQDSERILAIMKDSRIGSNGTLALLIYFSVRFLAGRKLLSCQSGPLLEASFILSTSNAIRLGLLWTFFHQKHAGGEQGLRTMTGGIDSWRIGLSILMLMVVEFICSSWQGLSAYLLASLTTLGFLAYVYRKIGGVTGDICGASGLICEMAYLFFSLAFLGEGWL